MFVGITGSSPLWALTRLYGFDIINDLVFDGMHCIALNVFKKYVKKFIEIYGSTSDGKLKIEEALQIVTNRRSHTMGKRWPLFPTTRLGYFKAEEHQMYVMWCLHFTMDYLRVDYEDTFIKIGLVLVKLGRLYFTHSRTHGWTPDTIEVARSLFTNWWKLVIDNGGYNESILEHVVGSGHLMDDILRHGPQDVHWIYKFEREVKNYMAVAPITNSYLYDVTFTLYHARILFQNTLIQIDEDSDGLYPSSRTLQKVHKHMHRPLSCSYIEDVQVECPEWHSNCIIKVNSNVAALELWKQSTSNLSHSLHCWRSIERNGIIIGPKRAKKLIIPGKDKG